MVIAEGKQKERMWCGMRMLWKMTWDDLEKDLEALRQQLHGLGYEEMIQCFDDYEYGFPIQMILYAWDCQYTQIVPTSYLLPLTIQHSKVPTTKEKVLYWKYPACHHIQQNRDGGTLTEICMPPWRQRTKDSGWMTIQCRHRDKDRGTGVVGWRFACHHGNKVWHVDKDLHHCGNKGHCPSYHGNKGGGIDGDLHATTETRTTDRGGWQIFAFHQEQGQSVDRDLHSTMETREEYGVWQICMPPQKRGRASLTTVCIPPQRKRSRTRMRWHRFASRCGNKRQGTAAEKKKKKKKHWHATHANEGLGPLKKIHIPPGNKGQGMASRWQRFACHCRTPEWGSVDADLHPPLDERMTRRTVGWRMWVQHAKICNAPRNEGQWIGRIDEIAAPWKRGRRAGFD